MSALQPMPGFIPSNITDEEFINLMESRMPRDVFLRMQQLVGAAQEQRDAVAEANAAIDKALEATGDFGDGEEAPDMDAMSIGELRVRFKEMHAAFRKVDEVLTRSGNELTEAFEL